MIEYYKLLSQEFDDSDFRYIDNKVSGSVGSCITVTTYYLNIRYKGFLIETSNELGNFNLGKISVYLHDNFIIDFKITSIDHFTNLFLRKKNTLKSKMIINNFKIF